MNTSFQPRLTPVLYYNDGGGLCQYPLELLLKVYSIPIDPSIRLDHKKLYYGISVSRWVSSRTQRWKSKQIKEINIVIMNMLAGVRKGKNLCYSRSTGHRVSKRYNKKNINSKNIIKAIDYLTEQGYCTNYIASSKQDPKEKRLPSFIVPSDKFIKEFCTEDEIIGFAEKAHLCASEVVILRDSDSNNVDYKDNEITIKARELIVRLNEISSKCEFRDKDNNLKDNFVSRIFNESSFTCGGRYAHSDFQVMSNKAHERLFTTIDGEQVVEVDFCNLFIRMLTDLRKVDHSKFKDDDLYHMPLSDDELNSDNRWLVKQAVNIMFNTSSERAAMSAIQATIKKRPASYCFKGAKEVFTAVVAAYPWLADDFCQPVAKGYELMNLESWIAHDVAEVFANINEPICIIHDSFIVKKKYEKLLVDSMVSAYRKHVQNPNVPVFLSVEWIERGNWLVDDSYHELSIVVRD